MAKKRMFSQLITESDSFTSMPLSTQALYFHLSMNADDDGFINAPKRVQRMIGASDDDMNVLLAKRFIIAFDSGVLVVKHWKINNTIRSDRYKETLYTEEKSRLSLKENGAYSMLGIPSDNQVDTNGIPMVCVDKVSIDKNSIGSSYKGEVDFLDLLSNEEIAYLKTLYKDAYDLIDEVSADATRKRKTIDHPLSYVIGYATNKGWVLNEQQA